MNLEEDWQGRLKAGSFDLGFEEREKQRKESGIWSRRNTVQKG